MVTALFFLIFTTSVYATRYNCTSNEGFIFWGTRCEYSHNNFNSKKLVTCNCAKGTCLNDRFYSFMVPCSAPRHILNSHYIGPQDPSVDIECDTRGDSCFLCKIPGQYFERCRAQYGQNKATCYCKHNQTLELQIACEKNGILDLLWNNKNVNCRMPDDLPYDSSVSTNLPDIVVEVSNLTVQKSGKTPGFWALLIVGSILVVAMGIVAFKFIELKRRQNASVAVDEVTNKENKTEPLYYEITECAAAINPSNDVNLYSEPKENIYANDAAIKTLRAEVEYLEILK